MRKVVNVIVSIAKGRPCLGRVVDDPYRDGAAYYICSESVVLPPFSPALHVEALKTTMGTTMHTILLKILQKYCNIGHRVKSGTIFRTLEREDKLVEQAKI